MQKNLTLVRTVREAVGDGVDIMADAYMGWNLDYAKRMIPQLEKYNLRWLEELVIPDEIHSYAELKKCGRIPISGGEHEFTLYGFRELIESHCVDYIHFAGAKNLRARRGAFDSGDSARRADAQLSHRHGELEFADSGIFSAGGCRSRQRTFLVLFQRRTDAGERLH
jgi:hypothetical protein